MVTEDADKGAANAAERIQQGIHTPGMAHDVRCKFGFDVVEFVHFVHEAFGAEAIQHLTFF